MLHVEAVECPAENTWQRYLGGDADDELHAHLDGCGDCRLVFAELARSERRLERGAQLGRYVVIDVIGRGGMGIVYKAFDPELDRAVAVKLVAVDATDAARQRLLREARTLAKLAHPNVVAVHDVGTFGDDVFVAMEYVAGQTLRQWLRTPRTAAEILDVLGQAARGLAAAHALAIVHRDFKPENVMVDDSGRARVLDFGLARSAGARGDAARAPTGSGSGRITRSGAVAGTPHYMAPEQAAASAASDQFSFCVVLYEALYGERPAPDARPPARRGVAGRVRRALQIGLRRDPARRHASMAVLLDALRPPRARVALAAVAVAALAVGGAAWTIARAPSVDSACRLAASDVARVWHPARRTELVAVAGEATARQVDAWTAAWSARRTELCAQTIEGDRDQSQDIAQQVGCLRRRLTALDAAVITIVNAKLAQDARVALGRVGSPTVCDSYERGTLDEATRAQWIPIFETIVRAYVAVEAGRIDEAEAAARSAVTAARARGEPDLVAGALGALGLVQAERQQRPEARATLTEAIRLATIAREDKIVVDSWNALLLMGVHGDDTDLEATIFAAEVAASKLPPDDPSRCMTFARAGTILARRGQLDPALAKVEEARACWERAEPAPPDALADVQFVIGLVQVRRGAWAEAKAPLEAAVAAWGKPRADLAMAHDHLGAIALIAEDDAAAERHFRRAADVARDVRDAAALAGAEGHLAYVLVRDGRCAEATPVLARARAHQAELHGERSLEVATTMLGQAMCALASDDRAHAKSLLAIAKPIIDAAPAANASTIALADFALARTIVATERRRAVMLAERALAKLAGHPLAIHRREIEAWLAANR